MIYWESAKNAIIWLIQNNSLKTISKEYPEFSSVTEDLNIIYEGIQKRREIYETEKLLLEDIQIIAQDKQLMLVIESQPKLTRIYNLLVDIYTHYRNKLDTKKKNDKEEITIGRQISTAHSDISGDTLTQMTQLSETDDIYNMIKDLLKHYQKRQILYTRMNEGPKEKT